jgi:signal peptidase I
MSEMLPDTGALKKERDRLRYRSRYNRMLKSTVSLLLIAAAVAILVVTLWMPVLQVYGSSMTPTLEDGEIVVLTKGHSYETGDIVAFYYNNKILIKRVIASAGDWVDIDDDGTVSVNGSVIDEPYVTEKSIGECDIQLPIQVPDGKIFVMGDHRSVSIDSRSSQIGFVGEDQMVGRLAWRVWPLGNIKFF